MIPFFAGIGIKDIRFWNGFQYSKKIDFCWNWNKKFRKNDENPIPTPIPESQHLYFILKHNNYFNVNKKMPSTRWITLV